jgi:hypothetical protein
MIFGRSARSPLQPVAPQEHNSEWVKEVLIRIDYDALECPPQPEPEQDFWLVDNAARVADN